MCWIRTESHICKQQQQRRARKVNRDIENDCKTIHRKPNIVFCPITWGREITIEWDVVSKKGACSYSSYLEKGANATEIICSMILRKSSEIHFSHPRTKTRSREEAQSRRTVRTATSRKLIFTTQLSLSAKSQLHFCSKKLVKQSYHE